MSVRDDDARPQQIGDRTSCIAKLNDQLRRHGRGGTLAATANVIALGDAALPAIIKLVRSFDAFTADNDLYGERDFGTVTYRGERLFWKIDYYDQDLRYASPDPADPSVTTRVLTIMLAEDY